MATHQTRCSRLGCARKPHACGAFLDDAAKAFVLDVSFEKAFDSDVTERVLEVFRDSGLGPPAVLHRGDPYPAVAAGQDRG